MDKTEQANDFLNIIRSLIKEEQQKQDRTEICQIDSVNEDGSLNIKMLSDFDQIRVIPNIQNQSVYEFKSGDFAIIYLIQNQLSNSFIIAKCQPRLSDLRNYVGDGVTVVKSLPFITDKKYVEDNFVKKISKQTIVEQVSSGNSYELSKISSLAFTINDSSFTSVNDVCQICFATESQFDITIPDGTYLCVGDGFSIDKKTISCIANKVYYITIGYTPFGIEIVSSIDEIASNNLAA